MHLPLEYYLTTGCAGTTDGDPDCLFLPIQVAQLFSCNKREVLNHNTDYKLCPVPWCGCIFWEQESCSYVMCTKYLQIVSCTRNSRFLGQLLIHSNFWMDALDSDSLSISVLSLYFIYISLLLLIVTTEGCRCFKDHLHYLSTEQSCLAE